MILYSEEESKALVCQCEPCRRKRTLLDVEQPKTRLKRVVKCVNTYCVNFDL